MGVKGAVPDTAPQASAPDSTLSELRRVANAR
ncbi:sulfonate ABC transporter ATP-binding protein [Pseudomonas syringae pv. actinidiae ICMP 18886]|nr:sulfonate ABC transporter ATP-binding protein [Pseudomonas syringae pv. actinidiae ICMP 18886]